MKELQVYGIQFNHVTWNDMLALAICFFLVDVGVYGPIVYPSKDYACCSCRCMLICFIALLDAGVLFEIPEDR